MLLLGLLLFVGFIAGVSVDIIVGGLACFIFFEVTNVLYCYFF